VRRSTIRLGFVDIEGPDSENASSRPLSDGVVACVLLEAGGELGPDEVSTDKLCFF